jgi:UDP-N-acetylglucosamine--N-acetylmuramyl-(pentapeptide) pyrophosphoryl-undecaprenol N-acetylglucosamine transferase
LKVVLCAGGTGGHLFPAMALAEALKKKNHEVIIVTDERGAVYCEHFENKKVYGSVRFSLKGAFTIGFKLIRTFFSFFHFCKTHKPDVIIGFGGIFTVVPIIVGRMCKAKIILYEQNTIIGRANRYLLNFSDMTLSAFSIGGHWKVQPSPVRDEFLKRVPFDCSGKLRILVIGGSQGAKSFSVIIPSAIKGLSAEERSEIEIVQQESYEDIDELKQRYDHLGVKSTISKFFHNVAELMGKSQLVICRSGSSTLMELSAMGRPAVLIPYPKAMDNHQRLNAKRYVDRNSAWMIEEDGFSSEKLKNILKQILKDRDILKQKAEHMYNKNMESASENFIRLIENI